MLRIDYKFVADVKAATIATDLHPLLQNALELEHATIPPYLTAAYSLKSGANDSAKDMILNIALEEMLHMAVVANVLNAIGGVPEVVAAVPQYPGPLPMCIGDGLQVGLRQCSLDLIRDTFMRIEEPEEPIEIEALALDVSVPQFSTIGQFYEAIIEKIQELGDAIFIGDPARQVVSNAGFPATQLFAITNADTAVQALTRVVQEGEGTKSTPFDDEGEPAHFYRFESIVEGRELVEDASAPSGYSYSGAEILFDPNEVWDFPDDTKAEGYAEGSDERQRVDAFNNAYSEVVRKLQEAFNGAPAAIVESRGLMTDMRSIAPVVVSKTNTATGRQCGLTFEYIP